MDEVPAGDDARAPDGGCDAAAVVHTDDVAWWHSRSDWAELLLDEIIEPFQAGQPVAFRLSAWKERDRKGALNVRPESSVLIVEGVGCSRLGVARWLDASVRVQADETVIAKRNAARIASGRPPPMWPDG